MQLNQQQELIQNGMYFYCLHHQWVLKVQQNPKLLKHLKLIQMYTYEMLTYGHMPEIRQLMNGLMMKDNYFTQNILVLILLIFLDILGI